MTCAEGSAMRQPPQAGRTRTLCTESQVDPIPHCARLELNALARFEPSSSR